MSRHGRVSARRSVGAGYRFDAEPRLAWLLGSAAAVVLCAPAQAQDRASAGEVSEVIVTAQKREERLQDVPIAVSAVSGDELQRVGARNLKDVLLSVPGVSFSGSEQGLSRYNIRGVSTNAESPTVGVYLDDVSLITVSTFFAGAADPAFFDFERIEVLRGPQGTLYGGSAMGGAIKYITRKPKLNAYEALGAAEAATTAHGGASYGLEAVVNLPLAADKVALRGGISFQQVGGYVDAVANAAAVDVSRSTTQTPPYQPLTRASLSTISGKDRNDAQTLAVRLAATIAPVPGLVITPSLYIHRYEQDNVGSFSVNLPRFQSSPRINSPTDDHVSLYALTIEKEFDEVNFTAISGYLDRELNFDRDYSYFIGGLVPPLWPLISFNDSVTDSETFTQEFRLSSSKPDSAWRWVAGLYYSDQKDRLLQDIYTPGIERVLGGPALSFSGRTTTKARQYAAFGEVTYSPVEKLDLTVGLRLFGLRQSLSLVGDGVLNGGHTEVSGRTNAEVGVNPKYGIAYRLTPDNLLYGTAAKGFRPGGPNRFDINEILCRADLDVLGLSEAPNTFKSDNLWTYELGSKNTLRERRFVVNGAVFYTDWKDIQQNTNLSTCGFTFTNNVGAAKLKGAELSVEGRATDRLALGGSLSYTDSKISESAVGVAAKVGQQVLDVPRWMANAFVSYDFAVNDRIDGNLRLDYTYHGKNLRDFATVRFVRLPSGARVPVPNEMQVQDAYHVVNLNIVFDADAWQLRLFANNLFDRAPLLDYAGVTATTLRPRTIGVGVRKAY